MVTGASKRPFKVFPSRGVAVVPSFKAKLSVIIFRSYFISTTVELSALIFCWVTVGTSKPGYVFAAAAVFVSISPDFVSSSFNV